MPEPLWAYRKVEAAQQLGVSQTLLSLMENAERSVTKTVAQKAVRLLAEKIPFDLNLFEERYITELRDNTVGKAEDNTRSSNAGKSQLRKTAEYEEALACEFGNVLLSVSQSPLTRALRMTRRSSCRSPCNISD